MGSGASLGLASAIRASSEEELNSACAEISAAGHAKLSSILGSIDGPDLQNCKLTYFPMAGRGLASQLALTLGGIKFSTNVVPFADWPAKQPSTPWLSMPVLELADGNQVAQHRTISRMIGKCVSLYPQDVLLAARVDELLDGVDEMSEAANNLGNGMEKVEKAAAQAEGVTTGIVATILEKIDAYIAAFGKSGCAVGDTTTMADLSIYGQCSSLICGYFDGIPASTLDKFSHIQAVRKKVATTPAVVEYVDTWCETALFSDVFKKARELPDSSAVGTYYVGGKTSLTITDLQNCKLTNLPLAGRGAPQELALALGGVKFEKDIVQLQDWPAKKPSTPWLSMPILTLADGAQIAQCRAILRAIGKCVSLYPQDPWLAVRVDELLDAFEDVMSKVIALGQGSRLEAITTGSAAKILENINAYIAKFGKAGYAVGSTLTIADVFIYCMGSNLISGLVDGIPANALDRFDRIQAVRKNVANLPAVIGHLDKVYEGKLPETYRSARTL